MPNDPGLAADACSFMEAISGDHGAHNGAGIWWLSPDIQLVGPTSGADKADPGVVNTVDVTLHNHGGNCSRPAGTESITLELWMGNPSLAMAPNIAASTVYIDGVGMTVFGLGTTATHQFTWTPPAGVPASDPQSPGHKCLIARCYADPLTPSANSFFAPDDPHVAQHNICVVPCGGPGAAKRPQTCGIDVTTINPDAKKSQTVKWRAVLDLNPDKFVHDVVIERLRKTKGFDRLAKKPPRGFTFRLGDVTKAKHTDRSKSGSDKRAPSYEVEVGLKAGQVVRFAFIADLSEAALGEAYIFHLTQVGANRRAQGGLTAVILAV
jgi:hypothetical protein